MAQLNKGLSFVELPGTEREGSYVIYDVDVNGVCTITMHRPEAMNAMDEGIIQGTCAAIALASDDPEVKVVILTGAGRGFCAGGDVKVRWCSRNICVHIHICAHLRLQLAVGYGIWIGHEQQWQSQVKFQNANGRYRNIPKLFHKLFQKLFHKLFSSQTISNKLFSSQAISGGIWQLRKNMYSSELLRNMGKVTIAAVNGACAGAGFSWVCACNLRYSVAGAKNTARLAVKRAVVRSGCPSVGGWCAL
jgi:enoyl-CoA hydratase/carnithine racemase